MNWLKEWWKTFHVAVYLTVAAFVVAGLVTCAVYDVADHIEKGPQPGSYHWYKVVFAAHEFTEPKTMYDGGWAGTSMYSWDCKDCKLKIVGTSPTSATNDASDKCVAK